MRKKFDPAMPMQLWAALRVQEMVAMRTLLAGLEQRQIDRREKTATDGKRDGR